MSGGGLQSMGGGFRPRGAASRGTLHFGPNMTPMVDIVMVILVFFMASAAFVGPEWFLQAQAVDRQPAPALTKPDGGGSVQAAPLVLRVLVKPASATGQLALATVVYGGQNIKGVAVIAGGSAGQLAAFGEAVKRLIGDKVPEQGVILADGAASYEAVVAVREALARVGVGSVGVSQLKPEDEP
jgi:biopolymer transport protein ExbD